MKTKTLKIRVQDKHVKVLTKQAGAVNYVWNYINALSNRSILERKVWLSGYDIDKYTKGSSKELGLNSQTIQAVSKEYTVRRDQFKKAKLSWRKSRGTRRSLGWIPFTPQNIKLKNGKIVYNGTCYSVWDSYGLENYKFRSGSFNEDSRGRWYFNVMVYCKPKTTKGVRSVGIDLGCKTAATTSEGQKLEGRRYRELESKLKIASRARNKKRVKAIHAKIANRRKDDIHKFTRKLVDENSAIFVGNVSSQKLVKTKMAKSVLDAGWGMMKMILKYKCDHAGIIFEEVNEVYTTQTCSCCGAISHNSPKGRAGLGIREWSCGECGTLHDRDINAAKNILALGHKRLAGGSSL